MSALSIFFAALFYLATAIFVVGLALKIRQYAVTPAPLKIALTPAPLTATGVGFRLTREVVFFESLFRSSKWTWAFGWMFHAALLLVVLRHVRYFQEPVWLPIAMVQPFGTYAGFAMVAGLAGLIEPLDVPTAVLWRDLPVMAGLALVLYLRGRDERRPTHLGRTTGRALVAVYLLHAVAIVITSGPG